MVAAAIWIAYKHQLKAFPPPWTQETRRKAHRAALLQLYDCLKTLDFSGTVTHWDMVDSLRPMVEPELAAYEASRRRRAELGLPPPRTVRP